MTLQTSLIDPPTIPFYSGKRCVVTGASGLIGSYVVRLLKNSGAWVRSIYNVRMGSDYSAMADETFSYDLGIRGKARDAVVGAEIVFSCAGITGGIGLTHVDALSYVGPATAMVINTLHACTEFGVERFGFLSSTTVYAPSEKAVKEEDVGSKKPLFPAYAGIGESKRYLEKLIQYYVDHSSLSAGIVRPSGAYGRFDNFDEKVSHVLPGMVNRALKLGTNELFEIWGDGEDVRDIVHAQDVAHGLLLAVKNSKDGYGPINIASGKPITTMELAKTIISAVGKDNDVITNPTKPSALKTRTVDISKAKKCLGYEPTVSLANGIADVVAWRRSL